MPKPPELPVLDWSEIVARGVDWNSWIQRAEDPERGKKMAADADGFPLPPPAAAAVAALPKPVTVVVIAEDWCGDVVRHVPVLEALARTTDQATTRYLSRAEAPDVFVRFLTNGGEAIPKMVFLSADLVETGSWGPMPTDCREIIARGKAAGDVATARKLVKQRYAADPARSEVVAELVERLVIAATDELMAPAE